MKLSASNIIWDSPDLGLFFSSCAELGCSGVELAPDKIWKKPLESSISDRKKIVKQIRDSSLELVGFHALLYTRRDLKLFKSKDSFNETILYLSSLASLCAEMGGQNLILGSPSNRSLCGRKFDDCFEQAVEGFSKIADICKKFNINFCIEPLPPFQTEFISSATEGERLVKAVNHRNFHLHLDASALRYEHTPPELVIKSTITPHHFHINDPDLSIPGSVTNDLPVMIKALSEKDYTGFLSVEVLSKENAPLEALSKSISYVKKLIDK